MKRKGFTLVEMLAVIVVLGIVLTLAVGAYTSYKRKSSDNSFKILVKSFENALIEASIDCNSGFSDNDFCDLYDEPNTAGETAKIYLKDLINNEYLDEVRNPYNTSEMCDVEKSYIEVTKVQSGVAFNTGIVRIATGSSDVTTGSTSQNPSGDINSEANGINDLSYRVCLICGSKESEGCE